MPLRGELGDDRAQRPAEQHRRLAVGVTPSDPREHLGHVGGGTIGSEPAGGVARGGPVAPQVDRIDGEALGDQGVHQRALLAGRLQVEVGARAPGATVHQHDHVASALRLAVPHGERVAVDLHHLGAGADLGLRLGSALGRGRVDGARGRGRVDGPCGGRGLAGDTGEQQAEREDRGATGTHDLCVTTRTSRAPARGRSLGSPWMPAVAALGREWVAVAAALCRSRSPVRPRRHDGRLARVATTPQLAEITPQSPHAPHRWHGRCTEAEPP